MQEHKLCWKLVLYDRLVMQFWQQKRGRKLYSPPNLHLKQETLTERERLSRVDLLVNTSLDQLIYMLKVLFTFVANRPP